MKCPTFQAVYQALVTGRDKAISRHHRMRILVVWRASQGSQTARAVLASLPPAEMRAFAYLIQAVEDALVDEPAQAKRTLAKWDRRVRKQVTRQG